jgi:hypothetical protein
MIKKITLLVALAFSLAAMAAAEQYPIPPGGGGNAAEQYPIPPGGGGNIVLN